MTPSSFEPRVRALIIHGESLGCAGAQRILSYFLHGAAGGGIDATVAMAPNPKLSRMLPPDTRVAPLPSNQRFTFSGLMRQAAAVRRLRKSAGFDLIHGWTARDWELSSLSRMITRRPAVGMLHEHPFAGHITVRRRQLMRWCARKSLDRVICVSRAVADACRTVGYPPDRLAVVRNGIPFRPAPPPPPARRPVRLGYLGILDDSKGLPVLFQMLDAASDWAREDWNLSLAGGTLDPGGEKCVAVLKAAYQQRPWWPRVSWLGWIDSVPEFLASIDLLIMPSTAFDAFPTVLLEAASAARPVFANRIGGVAEIVADGETGWIYDTRDLAEASRRLSDLIREPALLTTAGAAAASRVRQEFPVDRMVRGHAEAYRLVLSR